MQVSLLYVNINVVLCLCIYSRQYDDSKEEDVDDSKKKKQKNYLRTQVARLGYTPRARYLCDRDKKKYLIYL